MEKDIELFDLMSRMYSDMQDGFKSVNKRIDTLDTKVDKLDKRVSSLETKVDTLDTKVDRLDKRVSSLDTKVNNLDVKVDNLDVKVDNLDKAIKKANLVIESDLKPKITALFDGYSLTSNKIENIKKQVSKHDNFIIKRVK